MPSSWYKTFMAEAGVDVGSRPAAKLPPGPPMDLANMRLNGVRSIHVTCTACHHDATVSVDDQPPHLLVKSFERRMRCGACQSKQVDVRPAWNTNPDLVPRGRR